MAARNPAVVLLCALILPACILPADEPTGMELSWRLQEVNTLDGEEAQRLRSCPGGFVDELVFWITDANDVSRSETFRYDCGVGYQTPSEFSTEASDAFVELRPREYDVIVDLVGEIPGTDGELEIRRVRTLSVDVLSRSITLQDFDFGLEPVTYALTLEGVQSCDQATFSLRYADAEDALAEPPREADGGVLPLLYREAFVTNEGLSMAGAPTVCADLVTEHVLEELDPGAYVLTIEVDGTSCDVDLIAGQRGGEGVIDLANLPCDG
ncbi:MAG: hypothetical protein AAGA54_00730 [Myxococcota bacterium]